MKICFTYLKWREIVPFVLVGWLHSTCPCKTMYVLNYTIVEYASEATITIKSSWFQEPWTCQCTVLPY